MRIVLLCLSAVFLISGTALGEEEPDPPSVEDVVEQVRTAFRAKNTDALRTLAELPEPDPWLVVDELCFGGKHDAAEAFANAAQSTDDRKLRADTEKLAAYVAAWRKREPDGSERERLGAIDEAINSEDEGELNKIMDAQVSFQGEPSSVTQIELLDARAEALDLLGRYGEYEAVLVRTAKAARNLGWLSRAELNYSDAGHSAYQRSAWEFAVAAWRGWHALLERGDDRVAAAKLLSDIGWILSKAGDKEKALKDLTLARKQLGAEESHYEEAVALDRIALVYCSRGQYPKAVEKHNAAFELLHNLGTKAGDRGAATILGNIGNVHHLCDRYEKALEAYERARAQMEALGDDLGVARMTNNMGRVYHSRGDFIEAKTQYDKALAQKNDLKHPSAATTHGNIGTLYLAQGMYAKALRKYETALEMMRRFGLRAGEAEILSKIGDVHQSLGDYPKAHVTYADALAKMKEVGAKAGEAATLSNIGSVYQKSGNHEKALDTYEEARKMLSALGRRADEATTLANIGVAQDALGRYAEALATYNEALKTYVELENRDMEAMTLANIGESHQHLGQLGYARTKLTEGVDLAEELNAVPQQVAALAMLARLHLQMDKPSLAWSTAKAAMREIEELLDGLGDEQGAVAREQHHIVFAVGALAAARVGSTSDLCKCLEGGRASGLLEMLGGREAMAWRSKSLGEGLRHEEAMAKAAVRLARDGYDAAHEKGDGAEIEAARVALESANRAVDTAEARIQRKLKEKADLGPFRPKGIRDIRRSLKDDQALVLYGLFRDEAGPADQHIDRALALVLRKGSEPRVVLLDKASILEAACKPLTSDEWESALAQLRSPGRREKESVALQQDWDVAVARLQKLLVDPLVLGDKVKQVLISPEGPLCYLPFAVLFDEHVVAMTPSGTTHMRLLKDARRKQGEGVLALGNSDYAGVTEGARSVYYRGAMLEPLKATADEVEALGTKKLLGQDASEAGLRAALATAKRWRSVHLACHGLVNTERPMLSALALTRTGEDDGFLTAREVLGMSMPTDLAVLSACDTSRGKIVPGEGIMGFTRALMFAGAPRVICSLWKVDDSATSALMIKFYELWNPKDGGKGMGPADALKKAQEFVQGHEKWKEPYFWAAWTLWGLPSG